MITWGLCSLNGFIYEFASLRGYRGVLGNLGIINTGRKLRITRTRIEKTNNEIVQAQQFRYVYF